MIPKNKLDSRWERLGLIFEPNKNFYWSKTHAMVPTPTYIDGKLIVFYSGRNKLNQSSVGYFEVNLDGTPKVTYSSNEPVLSPGDLGCFDDNGVSPSCVLELSDGTIAMYYIGWNPGSTTRVNLFGGLAISKDRGKKFSTLVTCANSRKKHYRSIYKYGTVGSKDVGWISNVLCFWHRMGFQ